MNKKDINRLFLSERKRSIISSSLLILVITIGILGIIFFLNVIFGVWAAEGSSSSSDYPSGTLYSTVREKDFKNKK